VCVVQLVMKCCCVCGAVGYEVLLCLWCRLLRYAAVLVVQLVMICCSVSGAAGYDMLQC